MSAVESRAGGFFAIDSRIWARVTGCGGGVTHASMPRP
jgi:hypothetical protein